MNLPKTILLEFDGKVETCQVSTDKNGEIICTAKTGRFAKFPKDGDLKELAKKHNQENKSRESE